VPREMNGHHGGSRPSPPEIASDSPSSSEEGFQTTGWAGGDYQMTSDSSAQYSTSWDSQGRSYFGSGDGDQLGFASSAQLGQSIDSYPHVAGKSPANSPPTDDWFPSHTQIATGCQLFFAHIASFVPFIHQATFQPSDTTGYLLLSMLSLAYQHGPDPDDAGHENSGAALSERCFHRARALITSDENIEEGDEDGTTRQHVPLIQACLLLQICAMMYLCGDASKYGLRMHSRMILAVRACRLVQPAVDVLSDHAEDLELLWKKFIRQETEKRTMFAAHQIDTLWYQLLSIPRQLSHLEIKHELPCPETFWTASSSAEWAHRKLVAQHLGTRPMQYADVVRQLVSSGIDINSIPEFDPYGTVNITHFLASSAREVSGWCTMTGTVSTERIEPLRSSLLSLSAIIQTQQQAGRSYSIPTASALSEATWESAMLEMQIWSPSHTGGIVGRSMDDVLQQLSHLSYSCDFLCEPSMALNIQPHVDWFLRYLDSTGDVETAEAPWITLYAYNAFIIALHLVRGGIEAAMQVVGLYDVQEALEWGKKVFGRRKQRQLGKLAVACLDTLSV
jgi:hypothetical protein